MSMWLPLLLLFVADPRRCFAAKKFDDGEEIVNTVRNWTDQLSKELELLTKLARKEKVRANFSNANVIEEKWEMVMDSISGNIREMMDRKVKAVRMIKNHAELLAENRKEPITRYSSYDYYDTNNLTSNASSEDLVADRLEAEHLWRCSIPADTKGLCSSKQHSVQKNEGYHTYQSMNKEFSSFIYEKYVKREMRSAERDGKSRCQYVAFLKRPVDYYRSMEMNYDPHFDTEVNLDYSIVKVTPNVDPREEDVLNDIRWSEALDLTFKCNRERDPTITFQYFGSTKGFMRFYPAIKWSEEAYNLTYDYRIRSWYLEGISSAKDIVILLDRSGSMKGYKRLMATQIVNSILDTLTDNDYVNIYTFTNTSESLVDCFNDTLVQANEENLRLLREQLLDIDDKFYGDISLGMKLAFPLLYRYRKARNGVICNQAIMLITEGLDYEYDDQLFKIYNYIPDERYYRPIRMFTYLLGTEPTDGQRMKWIACANMGYFVNISVISEVREKVLKYLQVLSRPINLSPDVEPEPAWTALYVDMADRRLSNWLWKKFEGNLQRDILIQYEKEQLRKANETLDPQQKHFTRNTEHDYSMYQKPREYKYLTSVSLPVYNRRANMTDLVGVAGLDVPLDYIKQLTQPHRIGVNGYAFIITNNGYVLHHPDHRTEFRPGILKPTFNRVDLTEVEISDKTDEPRKFDNDIVQLRENIVRHERGHRELRVRHPMDNMRRVIISSRHYFYTAIGPFSLVFALPDRYGNLVIRHPKNEGLSMPKRAKRMENWREHPKWLYKCKSRNENCSTDLLDALSKDWMVTEWFDSEDPPMSFRSKYLSGVVLTFLATHAGLTRWKNFNNVTTGTEMHFANTTNKGPDEVYYRRSAEMNFDRPDMFLYSVPFEDYDERTTLITASNVVFLEKKNKRAPVAAVGFQILHKMVNSILDTFKCESNRPCKISCVDSTWTCYVLDNDGYIILAEDTQYIGKSLSHADNSLIRHLVKDGVFKEITVFDYQATCFPNAPDVDEMYGPTYKDVIKSRGPCRSKNPLKCKTIEYLRRQVVKTIPTPCDEELKMYNYLFNSASRLGQPNNINDCACPYVAQHIQGTNLVMVVSNNTCCWPEDRYEHPPTFPREISYNLTLPCYIATMNNFTKRHYTKCVIKNEKEYVLNADNKNCGGEGVMPIE